MPQTCAYRYLYEKKDLPDWHHLITGTNDAKHSIRSFCINETDINIDDIENYIIEWDEL